MLRRDNLAWLGLELATDFAAPRAVFERLSLQGGPLNGRNVLPGFVVAGTVSAMHRIEDVNSCVARGIQHLQHVRNAPIRFGDAPNAVPYLASLGNEVIVGIDYDKGCNLLLVENRCHEFLQADAVTCFR